MKMIVYLDVIVTIYQDPSDLESLLGPQNNDKHKNKEFETCQ
jgi:hypothetical protein